MDPLEVRGPRQATWRAAAANHCSAAQQLLPEVRPVRAARELRILYMFLETQRNSMNQHP